MYSETDKIFELYRPPESHSEPKPNGLSLRVDDGRVAETKRGV